MTCHLSPHSIAIKFNWHKRDGQRDGRFDDNFNVNVCERVSDSSLLYGRLSSTLPSRVSTFGTMNADNGRSVQKWKNIFCTDIDVPDCSNWYQQLCCADTPECVYFCRIFLLCSSSPLFAFDSNENILGPTQRLGHSSEILRLIFIWLFNCTARRHSCHSFGRLINCCESMHRQEFNFHSQLFAEWVEIGKRWIE